MILLQILRVVDINIEMFKLCRIDFKRIFVIYYKNLNDSDFN